MHAHVNVHFNVHYTILKGVENLVENNDLFLDRNIFYLQMVPVVLGIFTKLCSKEV